MSKDFIVISNLCAKHKTTQIPVKLFLQFIDVFIIMILILYITSEN